MSNTGDYKQPEHRVTTPINNFDAPAEQYDIDNPIGKYQNSMDTESLLAAKAFLECNFSSGFNHGFSDATSVLTGFRAFATEQRRYRMLPLQMQVAQAKVYFPTMVAGSWGHYAAHWIRLLKQADGTSELIEDVLYEFKQRGFLPQEYTA